MTEYRYVDILLPSNMMWNIINNIKKFDNRPEYIKELFKKFHKVKESKVLVSFANVVDTIEAFFNQHNEFPDIETLKLTLETPGIRTIVERDDPFSMQIYEALSQYIDQEILRERLKEKILEIENPTMDDMREMGKELTKFSEASVGMSKSTKEGLISSYEDYIKTFDGLKTHIKAVDDVIGVLGFKSLSVFAAPSGHGKSTFAMSVAYYAATHGKCVDYLSFEIPRNHAWFNMTSIESQGKAGALKSSEIKEGSLDVEQRKSFIKHTTNLLNRIKEGGGFLNIIDQTTAQANTYEGLCSMLETVAEERKRPADLIIVDNIDNFQTLKSKERDEATKINNYIIQLDGFSKKYCDGHGTTILLLSQVNRPALKKLRTSTEDITKTSMVDVTCIQKFNALYEKPTCVLIGYANEASRASGQMRVYPVKLRNRAVPITPILLNVDYAHSKVLGEFVAEQYTSTDKEATDNIISVIKNEADLTVDDVNTDDTPITSEIDDNDSFMNELIDDLGISE